MVKSIVVSLTKKYIVGYINELLTKNKDNLTVISSQINLWLSRLSSVINSLSKINERISDGVIEDEEIVASKNEIEKIIKEW